MNALLPNYTDGFCAALSNNALQCLCKVTWLWPFPWPSVICFGSSSRLLWGGFVVVFCVFSISARVLYFGSCSQSRLVFSVWARVLYFDSCSLSQLVFSISARVHSSGSCSLFRLVFSVSARVLYFVSCSLFRLVPRFPPHLSLSLSLSPSPPLSVSSPSLLRFTPSTPNPLLCCTLVLRGSSLISSYQVSAHISRVLVDPRFLCNCDRQLIL